MTTSSNTRNTARYTMGGIFSSVEVVTIFYRWYQTKEFWRYIEDIQYLGEVYDIPALKSGDKISI